jgi:hypothetical protein
MFLAEFRWIEDLMIVQEKFAPEAHPGQFILFRSCGRIFAEKDCKDILFTSQ